MHRASVNKLSVSKCWSYTSAEFRVKSEFVVIKFASFCVGICVGSKHFTWVNHEQSSKLVAKKVVPHRWNSIALIWGLFIPFANNIRRLWTKLITGYHLINISSDNETFFANISKFWVCLSPFVMTWNSFKLLHFEWKEKTHKMAKMFFFFFLFLLLFFSPHICLL